ncbi:unnamed protein product [Ectocarpus sp. CCAP 1310/34]|nr:unnamed protein product [Ectocarpus sp. CCAP 1310/34]
MSTPASHGIAGWVVPNANMNVKFDFVAGGRSPPSCPSPVDGVKRLGGRGCNSRKSWNTMSTSTRKGIALSPLSRLRLEEEVEDGLSTQARRPTQTSAFDLPNLVPIEDEDLIYKNHHFAERANWLVPGKVLLGKYPGQIPADLTTGPTVQIARDRVLDIVLRGGVTDLYCLQAELPPQDDESQWGPPADKDDNGMFFSGFRAYRGDAVAAVAAAAAAATHAPASGSAATLTISSQVEGDSDHSGNVAVNVGADNSEEEGGGGREQQGQGTGEGAAEVVLGARGEEGLAFHHFPIPDLSPAENTEILAGLVDELEALVRSGKVPFIHCWAGRGRTGLIASCLLGRLYPELSAEQSLNRVDRYYRTRGTVAIGKSSRVSPETPEQEEQVRLFFKQVLNRD